MHTALTSRFRTGHALILAKARASRIGKACQCSFGVHWGLGPTLHSDPSDVETHILTVTRTSVVKLLLVDNTLTLGGNYLTLDATNHMPCHAVRASQEGQERLTEQLEQQHVQRWLHQAKQEIQLQQKVAKFIGDISDEMVQTEWGYLWPDEDSQEVHGGFDHQDTCD
eukprot:632951-Amphidinium_carterae.2